ncbi:MAG: hypothetical protein RR439_01635 [Carnobacterium sp.]
MHSLRSDFIFTLGRKIDFSYKTNKIIAVLSLLVVATGWVLTGKLLDGVYIGVGVFLTWALSRELDPKQEYSAFLAVAFSLLNLFYYENIQLLVIFWILLLMRIVNGMTGKELTIVDIFLVLGLTIYLSLNTENSIYLLVFILAMALIIKASEKKKAVVIASGISLGFFIGESFFMHYLSLNNRNVLNPISLVAIMIVCLSFIFFWFLPKDKVEDDRGNNAEIARIAAGQLLFSAAVILLFFFDDVSMNNLVIYLSVILGVTCYFVGFKFLTRNGSL